VARACGSMLSACVGVLHIPASSHRSVSDGRLRCREKRHGPGQETREFCGVQAVEEARLSAAAPRDAAESRGLPWGRKYYLRTAAASDADLKRIEAFYVRPRIFPDAGAVTGFDVPSSTMRRMPSSSPSASRKRRSGPRFTAVGPSKPGSGSWTCRPNRLGGP
jgi:hypothetical protein